MEKMVVKSNHRFKFFEFKDGKILVSFDTVKAPAIDFWSITDEEKEKNPCLKNWSYILRKSGSIYHEAIVLQTRNDFKEYKIGYIYRNE